MSELESSWKSESSVDDSDVDSLYIPTPEKKKQKQLQLKRCRKKGQAQKKQTNRNLNDKSDSSDLENEHDDQPGTSHAALVDLAIQRRLDAVASRPKKRKRICTKFGKAVQEEPYRHGISDLPADFQWTKTEPPNRPDAFYPLNEPGSSFSTEQLPVEIFLALHKPALDLLLTAINETGQEFVAEGKWKRFRDVDFKELLRFHSILLFTQVVKISRLDAYWKKNSLTYQPFVAKQMSFKRFKEIKRAVRCYIPSAVKETGMNNPKSANFDKLYKITPMQNILLKSYRQYRNPPRAVTIDEQMVKFKVKTFL